MFLSRFGQYSKTLYKQNIPFYKPKAFFSKKDYYKVLSVDKSATQKDVKKSFVKLAQIWHPDRNPSDEAKSKFRDITEAYETLSDTKKRQMYDNYGMSADDQVNMGQGGENPFGDMGGFNMGDFFNQGGMGGQGQQGGNFEDVFKDFDDFFGMGGMGKKTHRSVKGQDIF